MISVGRMVNEAISISKANSIILNYVNHKTEKKVNLHYYHADWQDGVVSNLGDYLSEVVVDWLCKQKGIERNKTIDKTRHLYAIGSILQMGYQNATIWGSGFVFEMSGIRTILQRNRKLDIRCVRGPRTRRTLKSLGFDCPPYYGDPGVLLPLIYMPKKQDKSDYLIIPHFSVEDAIRTKYGDSHILSMNTKDYISVITKISSCEKIVSSSLHGIILAEAYGVPATFFQDRQERFSY